MYIVRVRCTLCTSSIYLLSSLQRVCSICLCVELDVGYLIFSRKVRALCTRYILYKFWKFISPVTSRSGLSFFRLHFLFHLRGMKRGLLARLLDTIQLLINHHHHPHQPHQPHHRHRHLSFPLCPNCAVVTIWLLCLHILTMLRTATRLSNEFM